MKFLVCKSGDKTPFVFLYSDKQYGTRFVANRKKATLFSLTQARKLAKEYNASVLPASL